MVMRILNQSPSLDPIEGRPHTVVNRHPPFWPATYTIVFLSSSTFWNTYICTPALFILGHGTSFKHIIIHMHTSACRCTLMDSHVYTCMQMHADVRPLPHPRLTLHTYVCICIHNGASACRCVHMHTHWGPTPWIPSICMHEREDGCMSVQMYADVCIWMTASIILFVVHRCMGCMWWYFTGYLQRVACLFMCNDVHPSRWFGPP